MQSFTNVLYAHLFVVGIIRSNEEVAFADEGGVRTAANGIIAPSVGIVVVDHVKRAEPTPAEGKANQGGREASREKVESKTKLDYNIICSICR